MNVDPGTKLLVVDDAPENIYLLFNFLQKQGIDTLTAGNGKEALLFLEENNVDLILLDVMMPLMDGFETCRHLQENPKTRNIPVIFMTALTNMHDKLKAFEAGAVDYVTKPLQFEEVLARISTHLHLHQLRKELERKNATLEETQHHLLELLDQSKEQKNQIELAVKRKSEFFAGISHEIRNPANIILGFSEKLYEAGNRLGHKECGECLNYLEGISAGSSILLGLVNNILDFSKMEAGCLSLEYKTVNPKDIFQTMPVLFKQKIEAQGLNFDLEISEQIPQALLLDEVRLRQVLVNLISNALKFTGKGGISVRADYIASEEFENQGILAFSVADTGIGIPPAEQERIFQAYEQQKDQSYSRYGGTGLGLAIVRRLLSLLKGDIRLDSVPNQGSTFTVTLPVEKPPPGTSDAEFTQHFVRPESLQFAPAKILIADDVMLNRKILMVYLERYDFDVTEAENGKQAFELAQEIQPDLILLDMEMPEMNGRETIARLKQHPTLRNTPVITVSGDSEEDLDSPPVDCAASLGKPINRTALLKQLMRFLQYSEIQEN